MIEMFGKIVYKFEFGKKFNIYQTHSHRIKRVKVARVSLDYKKLIVFVTNKCSVVFCNANALDDYFRA